MHTYDDDNDDIIVICTPAEPRYPRETRIMCSYDSYVAVCIVVE